MIVKIFISNLRTSKYIKQITSDLKGEIDDTIIGRDINTSLLIITRSARQKINRETLVSNNTLD